MVLGKEEKEETELSPTLPGPAYLLPTVPTLTARRQETPSLTLVR